MTISNQTPTEEPLLSPEESKLRTQIYLQQRIKYQEGFYRNRIREFQLNSTTMLVISAVLMFISSITSALSASAQSPAIACVTAVLPACAAAIASFRALYQWDRQATIYDDTWFALQEARLALPDEDYLDLDEYAACFPALVDEAEDALQYEASQWGQLLVSMEKKPNDISGEEVPPEP